LAAFGFTRVARDKIARAVHPWWHRHDAILLADREPQARQDEFAMLVIPMVADIRYHCNTDGPQARDDFPRFGEAAHMGIAGGEKAIWHRVARILLDREEQFRHGLIEAPSRTMRRANDNERCADPGARTKPERRLGMSDRDVGLARPHSNVAADVPTTCEIRV